MLEHGSTLYAKDFEELSSCYTLYCYLHYKMKWEMDRMSLKTATVTARIQPEIKQEAEEVLDKIGIPVSVVIEALYRQIIRTQSIPFPLTIKTPEEAGIPVRESMTDEEFCALITQSLEQIKRGETIPFNQLRKELLGDTHD